MAFEAILYEVEQPYSAGDRIEALAENHLPVSEALITIAGSVRSSATVLASLVETKLRGASAVVTRYWIEGRTIVNPA